MKQGLHMKQCCFKSSCQTDEQISQDQSVFSTRVTKPQYNEYMQQYIDSVDLQDAPMYSDNGDLHTEEAEQTPVMVCTCLGQGVTL